MAADSPPAKLHTQMKAATWTHTKRRRLLLAPLRHERRKEVFHFHFPFPFRFPFRFRFHFPLCGAKTTTNEQSRGRKTAHLTQESKAAERQTATQRASERESLTPPKSNHTASCTQSQPVGDCVSFERAAQEVASFPQRHTTSSLSNFRSPSSPSSSRRPAGNSLRRWFDARATKSTAPLCSFAQPWPILERPQKWTVNKTIRAARKKGASKWVRPHAQQSSSSSAD